MKEIHIRLWTVSLLLLLMGQNEAAAQYTPVRVDKLNYWIVDPGAWVVKNSREGFVEYPYMESEYVVPETITVNGKSYPVEMVFAIAFSGSPIRRITLPSTLETIESSAFQNSNLSEINIPKSVKTIRNSAFMQTDLTQLEIPSGVTNIGVNIVWGCQKLRNIFVDKGNLRYRAIDGVLCTAGGTLVAFPGSRKGTYVTPSSVREIGECGLWNINHLDTLVLSEGIETLCTYAFHHTSSLTMLVIGSTLKHIESLPAFKTNGDASLYCFAATRPKGAFGSVETMKNVTLYVPKGCKEAYQEGNTWKVFKEIKEMEDGMTIDKLNIRYSGPTYGDYPMEHTQVFVTKKDGVYYNLYPLTGEAKVQKDRNGDYREERYALPACITAGNQEYRLTEIDLGAFEHSNLRELTLPEGLIRIGSNAFFNTNLDTFDLPATVKEIGSFAFGGYTPIKTIICRATVPPVCEGEIIRIGPKEATLYVPKESIDSYRQASVWSEFQDIRAINTTGLVSVSGNGGNSSALYYDLQGSHVQQPQRSGIYINGNKKIYVK